MVPSMRKDPPALASPVPSTVLRLLASKAAMHSTSRSHGGQHQEAACATDDHIPRWRARAAGPTRLSARGRGDGVSLDACALRGGGAGYRANCGVAEYVGAFAVLTGDATTTTVHVDVNARHPPSEQHHFHTIRRDARAPFSLVWVPSPV